MADDKHIVNELISRYGIKSIAAGIALGIVVWGLAHFAAKPGTPVSVLWGLVTYTTNDNLAGSDAQNILGTSPLPNSDGNQVELRSSPSTPSIDILKVENSNDRIYIDVNFQELLEKFHPMTNLQGNSLFQTIYLGKWVRIRGPVSNVYGDGDGDFRLAQLTFDLPSGYISVILKSEEYTKVLHLEAGDVVIVDGKFRNILSGSIHFNEGEIVSSTDNQQE